MESQNRNPLPAQCPSCGGGLVVTRLQCVHCSTEIGGSFGLGRLASLPEPHAYLIELFLRVRGNVKEMERELGLSYPTVRARLEEALNAAGFGREATAPDEEDLGRQRSAVLQQLEDGEITPSEAAARLRDLRGAEGRR